MITIGSERLSPIDYRPQHTSLTHFFRRNWSCNPLVVQTILSKCNVVPYLGALPPELRARVPKQDLADVTYKFRRHLEKFLIDKFYDVQNSADALTYDYDGMGMLDAVHYDMTNIGGLFKTQCYLDFGDLNYAGIREWSGFCGIVGKMSFPELHSVYALKVFNGKLCPGKHGAMFEIPTAFAAMHAEPRDNSRVYMASLMYQPYMLSCWEGDVEDGHIRKNENEIFMTSRHEAEPRNYRNGRRIDYGETYRTVYGSASYRVRKMYRKIIDAIQRDDSDALRQMAQDASVAAPAAKKEYCQAMDLVGFIFCYDVRKIMNRAKSY